MSPEQDLIARLAAQRRDPLGAGSLREHRGCSGETKAAKSEPRADLTAEEVDRQWRGFGLFQVMLGNPNVSSFVCEKESEIKGLWKRIDQIASQTDPAWALKLAKQFIAEREA